MVVQLFELYIRDPLRIQNNYIVNIYKVTLGLTTGATYNMNLYKVTLGLTTGATYNMSNVHVFKAAQARRAYFFLNVQYPRKRETSLETSQVQVRLTGIKQYLNFGKDKNET